MWTILPLLLGLAQAAEEPEQGPQSAESEQFDQAEYARKAEEMRKLASRSIWPGVERIFLELTDHNEVLSYDDYVIGAQSARALGKAAEMKERLGQAMKRNYRAEDTREWLDSVQTSFGVARIYADPGAGTLAAVNPPFAPDLRASIEYAGKILAETGSFEGLLPAGEYTLQIGKKKHKVSHFTVVPQVASIYIDRRTKVDGR